MDALAQQAVGAGIQLSADHYLAAKQSNRELKDQQASTPHKVRKQAPGQHKPVHPVHGHEVMDDPALQMAKPSQNGLFGRSPSAPGTMYVPEPRLETEAIGYQLSEQNRARMQQHQAASSSSASGSRRHLFAISSSEKTGSLADVMTHQPSGTSKDFTSAYIYHIGTETGHALYQFGADLYQGVSHPLNTLTGFTSLTMNASLAMGSFQTDLTRIVAHTDVNHQAYDRTTTRYQMAKEEIGNKYSRNWSDITSHEPIRIADATMSMAGDLFALWGGRGVIAEAAKVGYQGLTTLAEISRPVVRYGLDVAAGAAETAKYGALYTVVDMAVGYPNRRGMSFFEKPLNINSILFENKFPEDIIARPNIIPKSQLNNINGTFNYVVSKEGELIIGKGGRLPGRGHIDLASGNPVQAAGEFKIVSGKIKYIDNSSGHYLPEGLSAQKAAVDAFRRLGFDVDEIYVEKKWYFDSTLPRGGKWGPIR